MNTEIKIIKDSAATVYISHPKASYAIFCYNSTGDLFMNSDWGFMGTAWRAYGINFLEFLQSLNAEYVLDKFETNYISTTKKQFSKRQKESLIILVEEFLKAVKNL